MTGAIQKHPVTVAEDVGSSVASSLEDTLAAAGRSDRVTVQREHDEVCAAEETESCVIGEKSLSMLRVISNGIKLPDGVTTTSVDGTGELRW